MVPSAWKWAHVSGNAPSRFLSVSLRPSFEMAHGFLLRREAPDVHKLDLAIAAKRGLGLPALDRAGRIARAEEEDAPQLQQAVAFVPQADCVIAAGSLDSP